MSTNEKIETVKLIETVNNIHILDGLLYYMNLKAARLAEKEFKLKAEREHNERIARVMRKNNCSLEMAEDFIAAADGKFVIPE